MSNVRLDPHSGNLTAFKNVEAPADLFPHYDQWQKIFARHAAACGNSIDRVEGKGRYRVCISGNHP